MLAPAAAALPMKRMRSAAAPVLSQRELEVLRLVAGGATNREVAAGLFITEATVKSHLPDIYGKFEVGDRGSAVTEAFHRGLRVPRINP